MTATMTSLLMALTLMAEPMPATAGPVAETPPPAGTAEPAPRESWGQSPSQDPTTQPTSPATSATQPTSPPPETASPPAPVVSPEYAAGQPPPPIDQAPRRSPAGRALLGTGVTLIVVGGVSLIFVAVPSAIVKAVALNRARRDPVIAHSSREARYRRARQADDAMEAGFWVGVAGLGIGIPLTIAGAVLRSRARSEVASRVAIDGSGVGVRF